jgi:hypothetical protein
MKKIKYLFSVVCLSAALITTSCDIDNYEEADGTLTGKVIDSTTGEPIITEQPNGFRVYYTETGYSETARERSIWGKADGTFNHSRLFANTYAVQLRDGAFTDTETKAVEIKSCQVTNVDFTVIPYLSLKDVSIEKSGSGSVKIKFTIHKNVDTETLRDYRVFATSRTPLAGYNATDSGSDEIALTEAGLDVPIENTLALKNFVAGKTYYVRLGARTNNSAGRYNLSEVVELKM